MPSIAKVTLKWDNSKISLANRNAVRGLFQMGFDIASQARRNAPYVTGALRNTIRVQEAPRDSLEVIAGGTFATRKVNYAWKREQGPNRVKATEHYMENAAKSVMSGNYIYKYFKDLL